jgi:hypothetical protein
MKDMAGRGGAIMAIRNIRAPRPRIARARSMTAMSVIVLQVLVGMSFSARADDLEGQRVVDASLITCGEFLRMPLLRALVLVGWVGGFYAGRKNDTKVEVPAFMDEADRVISLCRENESMRLKGGGLILPLRIDEPFWDRQVPAIPGDPRAGVTAQSGETSPWPLMPLTGSVERCRAAGGRTVAFVRDARAKPRAWLPPRMEVRTSAPLPSDVPSTATPPILPFKSVPSSSFGSSRLAARRATSGWTRSKGFGATSV